MQEPIMNPFRSLPAVNEILEAEALQGILTTHPWDDVVVAVRDELEKLREQLARGENLDGRSAADQIAERAAVRVRQTLRPKLRTVINATGIILHTNLGRAPVAEAAARAAFDAARGYLNLELDLRSGERSSRQDCLREWVCRLTG